MAASVANLRDLILEIAGSKTPALRLSFTTPSVKSSPTLQNHLNERFQTFVGYKINYVAYTYIFL